MLYGSDGLGQRYWNIMIDKGDTTLVRELIVGIPTWDIIIEWRKVVDQLINERDIY